MRTTLSQWRRNGVRAHVGQHPWLEQQQPESKFMRTSRSTIVNLDRIKELQPLLHGEYAVILRHGTKLTSSRGYRDKLVQLMGREP